MKRRTFLASAALTALARPALAQSSKTLTVLTWNIVDQAALFKTWFAEFGKTHPGVEIEWLDKKGPDLPAFYQTQLFAGTPPDIVDLQDGIGVEYAADGALLDLTPMLAAHPEVKARFNPDYLETWVYQGKNWLVPFYITKTLIFYNKLLFRKAGIEQPATTFGALMTDCEKIGGGERTGFVTLTFDWSYWALFHLNGIDLLTPDMKHTAFDTPKMIDVTERLAKGTAGSAINKISWTGRWVEPLGAFASGNVGMLNSNSNAYFFIKGQGPWINADTMGVAELPGNWSVPNSHGWAISKGSKNPELAWDFIVFCTAQKQALQMANNRKMLTGNIAVDKALMTTLRKEEPLAAAVIETQLQYTNRMCGDWPLPNDSRIKEAFYPQLQNALLGRTSAKAALAQADRDVTRELKRA